MSELRTRYFKFALLAVAVTALLLITALGLIIAGNRQERKLREMVQQRLARIASSGQPVTAEQLAQLFPDPPAERDASRLLQRSLSLAAYPESLSTHSVPVLSSKAWPGRKARLSTNAISESRRFVLSNQEALDALPAVWPDDAWMPNQFALGFTNADLALLLKAQTVIEALITDCLIQIEAGDREKATKDIMQCLRISRTPRYTVLLHLLGRMGENLSCQALERLLSNHALSPQQLTGLSEVVSCCPTNRMRNVLLAHRCLGISLFRMVKDVQTRIDKSASFSPVWLLRKCLQKQLYSDGDFVHWLDITEQYVSALRQPSAECLRCVSEVDQLMRKLPRSSRRIAGEPAWYDTVKSDAEIEARMMVSGAALALEAYRLSHSGNLPDSLENLSPQITSALPVDPFDLKTLRYAKRSKGYVIYSVGPNGQDDGGREKAEGNAESLAYDITFTVER